MECDCAAAPAPRPRAAISWLLAMARSSPTPQALRYRPLPLSLLWRPDGDGASTGLRVAWCLSLIASVLLGLATVAFDWSGLTVRFGGANLYLTVYPPLTLCSLWVLCVGFWWGAVPAYLATLTLALYAGMAWSWALVFALANPLGYFVLAVAYRAVQMQVPPRNAGTLLFFVAIAFIASVFGATGSFIWSYTGQVGPEAAFAIWQGWWLGSFLQTLLFVGPLLAAWGPQVMRWRDTRFPPRPAQLLPRWRLFAASLLGVGGVLAFLWLSFHLGRGAWLALPAPATPEAARRLLQVVNEYTLAVYWILTVLTLAVLFLGHHFFQHWTDALERARERTAIERDLAVSRHQEAEQARQELAARIDEIQLLQAQLREQAVRDPLTGLYNRRHLQEALPRELKRAQRQGACVAVVVMDLDHFKQVNDQHGHAMGDRVLQAVAELLQAQTRVEDFCARYGGEEFCLVLCGANAEQTVERLQALQQRYAQLNIEQGQARVGGLSFSAGVAVYPQDGHTDDALLNAADNALYRAKAAGRNRICLADQA